MKPQTVLIKRFVFTIDRFKRIDYSLNTNLNKLKKSSKLILIEFKKEQTLKYEFHITRRAKKSYQQRAGRT